jgi:hypothetical protein
MSRSRGRSHCSGSAPLFFAWFDGAEPERRRSTADDRRAVSRKAGSQSDP